MHKARYAVCVGIGTLVGAGVCYWATHGINSKYRPIIGRPDNAESLNNAVDTYQQWCADNVGFSPQLPPAGTPGYIRTCLEREQKRFAVLSSEFKRHLRPFAGTGGANAKYLYDLSLAQEQAIARWLDADATGQSSSLPDLYNQIDVNSGALERAVMLFKLLLGREDHGIKSIRMVYRDG